jgi:hypothetical protein
MMQPLFPSFRLHLPLQQLSQSKETLCRRGSSTRTRLFVLQRKLGLQVSHTTESFVGGRANASIFAGRR